MKTLLTFLALTTFANAQQPYVVQQFNGYTVLVPLGPIKSGTRNFSRFDTSSTYRESSILAPPQRTYMDMTSPKRSWVMPQPTGKTVIIWNPYR